MVLYDPVLVRRFPQASGPPALLQIGPIKWTGLTFTREAGAAGQLNIGCTVDSLAQPVKDALLDLSVAPCELWCYRDGDLVHAGPVTNYQIQGRALTIYAPGLLGYLGYMVQASDYLATDTDQAQIVTQLIDGYQGLSYGHFGIDTAHVALTGTTRDLTLTGSQLNHLDQVISEMGQRDNGFDLAVDPTSRRLQMFSPRQGTDLSAIVSIDGRSISTPNYSQSVGPGQVASDVAVTASATGGVNLTSSAADSTLRSTFGRVMATASFSDVTEQTTLDDHAARLLEDSDGPLHQVSPDLLPAAGFAYGDFGPGDLITYDYDAGLGAQTFVVRVKTFVVTLDKGTERFGLTFF